MTMVLSKMTFWQVGETRSNCEGNWMIIVALAGIGYVFQGVVPVKPGRKFRWRVMLYWANWLMVTMSTLTLAARN